MICTAVNQPLQTNPNSYDDDHVKKINNISFTFPEVIVRDASKIFYFYMAPVNMITL